MLPAFSAIEQHEGSEMRQLDSLLKNQRRFHAAIGEKNAAVALWQGVSVLGHFNISANWDLDTSRLHRTGLAMLVPHSVAAS
jgi:hypothetical protein